MHTTSLFLTVFLDIKEWLQYLKPEYLLHSLGPIAWIGVIFMIFAETGLFVGFFFPGDSLLFTAGLLSKDPETLGMAFPPLLILLLIAGIIGNTTGYYTGRYLGPRLFKRDDSLIFKKKYLDMTESFYNEHGSMALILGRFIPIIRTFAPILAGAIKMNAGRFFLYNVIGAILWIGSITTIGFLLGNIEWVHKNLELIVLALIIITIIPVIRTYRKENKKHKAKAE